MFTPRRTKRLASVRHFPSPAWWAVRGFAGAAHRQFSRVDLGALTDGGFVIHFLESLEQSQIWRTADGRVKYVGELDEDHLVNIIAYLERNANSLLEHRRWYEQRNGIDVDERGFTTLDPASALDWIRDRPIYTSLLSALRRKRSIDGNIVDAETVAERVRLEHFRFIFEHYGDAIRELGER